MGSDQPVLYPVGHLLHAGFWIAVAYVLLAFPSGRLDSALSRWILRGAALARAAAGVAAPWRRRQPERLAITDSLQGSMRSRCRDWARRRSRRAGHRGSREAVGASEPTAARRDRACAVGGRSGIRAPRPADARGRQPRQPAGPSAHGLTISPSRASPSASSWVFCARGWRTAVVPSSSSSSVRPQRPATCEMLLPERLGIRRSRSAIGSRTAAVMSTSTADRSSCRPQANRGRCPSPSGTVDRGARPRPRAPRRAGARAVGRRGGRTCARERATPSRAQGTALRKPGAGAAASAD